MNSFYNIIFLISLSGMNLLILGSLKVLDFANVTAKQKLFVIKSGLIMIMIAPIVFIYLKLASWHTLEIILPDQLNNTLDAYTIPFSIYKSNISWPFYIFLLYGAGLFIMLIRLIFSYLNARNQLNKSSMATIQGETVFLNKYIQSPLSFGFLNAKIYFPMNAESKWTQREIQMSIMHEKIHIRQKDSFWKLFSLIAQAILFFCSLVLFVA